MCGKVVEFVDEEVEKRQAEVAAKHGYELTLRRLPGMQKTQGRTEVTDNGFHYGKKERIRSFGSFLFLSD